MLADFLLFGFVDKRYIQARLVCGEFGFDPNRCFDHPVVVELTDHDEVIFEADLFLNRADLVAWEAWHDTVDQCGAEGTAVFQPCDELGTESPVGCMLQYQLIKTVCIVLDQLTADND